MTSKPILYSDHAIGRMKLRGFTRADVREILALGESFPAVHARGSVYHEKWRRLDRRGAAGVVYVEDAHQILVVTVEWIDWSKKGGTA